LKYTACKCSITTHLVFQDPHELPVSRLTTPTKNEVAHGHTSSLQPSKMAPKRKGPGMSIVNPGSKRVSMKQGVQYEDDGSDS
jgi:hypothetical protein